MAEADVGLEDFKNIFSLEGKVAVVTGGSRWVYTVLLGMLWLPARPFTILTKCHASLLQAGCSKSS